MNEIQDRPNTKTQSAATEKKSTRARRSHTVNAPAEASVPYTSPSGEKSMNATRPVSDVLNATTNGKFVLFTIARADQVDKGPVMRGFIEVKAPEGAVPVKVNVAAWLKIGRNGTEYVSLKIGNNSAQDPEDYTVGPFYGRLFRQVEGNRTRYFGFVENAEKTGEDESGHGTYERHWQIRVTAKPATSNDQRTRYIAGSVTPSQQPAQETVADNALPF